MTNFQQAIEKSFPMNSTKAYFATLPVTKKKSFITSMDQPIKL
jgi:hypothetical protein